MREVCGRKSTSFDIKLDKQDQLPETPTIPKPSPGSTVISAYERMKEDLAKVVPSDCYWKIIESSASKNELGSGFCFRPWNYTYIMFKIKPEHEATDACLDTGCGVSLIDRNWLKKTHADTTILRMASPLKVRGVGTNKYETDEFAILPIYLPGKDKDGQDILACLTAEFHLVDNLRAQMLIGNDIIGPQGIIIDVSNQFATIFQCESIQVPIEPRQRSQFVRRNIHAQEAMVVPPHSEVLVPVKIPQDIPTDRDFIFEPKPQKSMSMYAYLVDSTFSSVLVKNSTDKSVQIPRKSKLGAIQEMAYENCFFATNDWAKKAAAVAATTATIATGLAYQSPCYSTCQQANLTQANLVYTRSTDAYATSVNAYLDTTKSEVILHNGVIVYGDAGEVEQLEVLVNEFPTLWVDTGFVDIPQDDWMKIQLRDDWHTRIGTNNRAKVYPLGIRD